MSKIKKVLKLRGMRKEKERASIFLKEKSWYGCLSSACFVASPLNTLMELINLSRYHRFAIKLELSDVNNIHNLGGTLLGSSRGIVRRNG